MAWLDARMVLKQWRHCQHGPLILSTCLSICVDQLSKAAGPCVPCEQLAMAVQLVGKSVVLSSIRIDH